MFASQRRPAETSYEAMGEPRQDLGPDYAAVARAKGGGGGRGGPRKLVAGVGSAMLLLLCILPIWSAVLLLMDGNFVFFLGRSIPLSIIFVSISVVLLYATTVLLFFRHGQREFQTEQTVMMISSIFVTLLGLSLLLIAIPFYQRAQGVYKDLRGQCGASPSTARLSEYYQVLLNIRKTPACAQKLTVKECPGFADSLPYTGFLEYVETNLKCSGFCQGPTSLSLANAAAAEPLVPLVPATAAPPPAAAPPSAASAAAPPQLVYPTRPPQGAAPASEGAALLAAPAGLLRRHADTVTPLSLAELGRREAQNVSAGREGGRRELPPAGSPYPPTLFSDANYQISCDGAMSRSMRYSAQNFATQIALQGICLVFIAIGTGFLKLIGLCVRSK